MGSGMILVAAMILKYSNIVKTDTFEKFEVSFIYKSNFHF